MAAVEEIINVNDLLADFRTVVDSKKLQNGINEIIIRSKVDFNYNDEDEIDSTD